jgi:hypothetical protein
MNTECQENKFTGESQERCACCGEYGWNDEVRNLSQTAEKDSPNVHLCENCIEGDDELKDAVTGEYGDVAKDWTRTLNAASASSGGLYAIPQNIGAKQAKGGLWELIGGIWEYDGEILLFCCDHSNIENYITGKVQGANI